MWICWVESWYNHGGLQAKLDLIKVLKTRSRGGKVLVFSQVNFMEWGANTQTHKAVSIMLFLSHWITQALPSSHCKEKTESNREEILTGFSPSCLALLWAVVVYSNGFIYSSVKIGIKPITHMPIRDRMQGGLWVCNLWELVALSLLFCLTSLIAESYIEQGFFLPCILWRLIDHGETRQ